MKISVDPEMKLILGDETESSPIAAELEPEPSCSPQPSPEKSEKVASDSDSSDGAVSKDSSSLTPSDLTPSDQRSHDDIASSNKESDNTSSSDMGQLPTDPADEENLVMIPTGKNLMSQVFIPMSFARESSQSGKTSMPSWLQNTQFNEQVKMNYKSPTNSLEEVLETDQQQLETMYQPKLVQDQLDELMVQLKHQVTQALTPIKLGEENEMSDYSGSDEWGPTGAGPFSRGSHSSEDKGTPHSSSSLVEDNSAELGSGSAQAEQCSSQSKKEVQEGTERKGDSSNKSPRLEGSKKADIPNHELRSEIQNSGNQVANSVGKKDSLSNESSDSTEPAENADQSGVADNTSRTAALQAGKSGNGSRSTTPVDSTGSEGSLEGLSVTEHPKNPTTQTNLTTHSSACCAESASRNTKCCSPRVLISEVESAKEESHSLVENTKPEEEGEKIEMIVMMKNLFTSEEDMTLLTD